MNLTTEAGSGPAAQAWPPTVRGTIVGFNMFVRSTTARVLAPSFASKAIAWPLAGLMYAVTVCGSKPVEKPSPQLHVIQSEMAGVPLPDVEGSAIAVKPSQPNSSEITPV